MDLDDTTLPFKQEKFADLLEGNCAVKFFARRYDKYALNDLYIASRTVWKHLCSLDEPNYWVAQYLCARDFANCFAIADDSDNGFNRILKT